MKYEYDRQYLNLNLRCPLCNQGFLATEIGTAKKRKKKMVEDATVGSSSSG
jgi:hypothetical protein